MEPVTRLRTQELEEFRIGPPVEGVGPLAVRVIGETGPAVVLIHGLGRVAAAWGRVAARLDGKVRLVLPDNPGLGKSSGLPVPKTIEEHAELHLRTLDALRIESLHVAGLSLGGMIAPALAARLGKRCASLTIFSASSRETGFWRLDPFSLLRMAGRVILTMGIDHRVNMPELVRPARLAAEPDLHLLVDRIQKAEGFSARNGLRQFGAAFIFRMGPHVAKLPERRLVVVGTDDLLVPPSNSERLARLLGAPILRIAEGAHDLGIDDPRAVAGILEAMATGADPASIRPPESGPEV